MGAVQSLITDKTVDYCSLNLCKNDYEVNQNSIKNMSERQIKAMLQNDLNKTIPFDSAIYKNLDETDEKIVRKLLANITFPNLKYTSVFAEDSMLVIKHKSTDKILIAIYGAKGDGILELKNAFDKIFKVEIYVLTNEEKPIISLFGITRVEDLTTIILGINPTYENNEIIKKIMDTRFSINEKEQYDKFFADWDRARNQGLSFVNISDSIYTKLENYINSFHKGEYILDIYTPKSKDEIAISNNTKYVFQDNLGVTHQNKPLICAIHIQTLLESTFKKAIINGKLTFTIHRLIPKEKIIEFCKKNNLNYTIHEDSEIEITLSFY